MYSYFEMFYFKLHIDFVYNFKVHFSLYENDIIKLIFLIFQDVENIMDKNADSISN